MITKVIILQGTSGSGKSTWAKKQPSARIVSADYAHIDPVTGEYRFTEEGLTRGHREALKSFTRALISAAEMQADPWNRPEGIFDEIMIVDNTNTKPLFMAPYVALATSFGFPVEILSFRAPAEVCAARNGGRAPLNVVLAMCMQIENFVLPAQWERDGVTLKIVETNA